jgi:hypothetical protein
MLYAGLAICLSALAQRLPSRKLVLPAVVLAAFCGRGLLQIGFAYGNLTNFSPAVVFTDAEAPLARHLSHLGVRHALVTDWGIDGPIRVRTENRIAVDELWRDLVSPQSPPAAIEAQLAACRLPDCVVVSHTSDRQIVPARALLASAAARARLAPAATFVIADSRGTPTFEVFGLRPLSSRESGRSPSTAR